MERARDHPADRPVPDASHGSAAEGVLGGVDLGTSLLRWAADAAVDEAARLRARERWLRIQAEEDATLLGALVDLAERQRPVTLEVAGGRVRGEVVGLGVDFVAVRTDRARHELVRLAAVEVLRPDLGGHPGAVEVIGDRTPLLDVTLGAVLGPLAADRPDVVVRTLGGAIVRGELRAAGGDVVRVRADGDPPAPVWVAVDAIAVLVLDP